MDYLPDCDIEPVTRRSSIKQYEGFIGVYKDGMYLPLIFDQMDGIVCGEVRSHPIMIYTGEWVGYNYPVNSYDVENQVGIIGRNTGTKIELLPPEFGRGDCWHNSFYERKYDDQGFTIDDYGVATGFTHKQRHYVGLDYVTTDNELESVD